MKKEYVKPQMEVVKIQHRTQLLAGSPGNQDALSIPGGEIDDEGNVW